MIMIVLLLAVGEIGFDLEIVTDAAVVLFLSLIHICHLNLQ